MTYKQWWNVKNPKSRLHTAGVTCSIHVSPTNTTPCKACLQGVFCCLIALSNIV